jgi:hypothetical protein
VTAQDGTTVRTYSVRFNRVRNNNALLSNLLIEGVQVGGFSPADANYTVELPFGTTTVPVVTAVPEDVNATVAITPAANLPGNTYVRVTAEDGVTNKTYSVSFVLLPASTDATLSDLMVNGVTLTGFNPATQDYTYTLPFGTTTVPVVTAVTSHDAASMVIRAATLVPGITTVTVTAQDVRVNKTYTINFIPGKSNDASLAELVVDGIPVNGFSKNTLDYSITLPFGTTVIPLVSGTPANANATRSITQAGSLPGTAYVVIIAEDGTTSLTYSVFFNLSAPSSDATLSGLQVDGSLISGFNPSQLTYQVTLPYGTTRVPEVLATANHNRASIVIMRANALPGITTVQVTAQDATTRKDYAIQFNVAKNSDATLAAILINGVSLPEFDRVDLSYEYVVPSGTTTAPAISAIPNDPKASAQIILPDAIPGTATIKVTAEDGISTSSYQILVRYPLSGIDEQSVNRSIRVYPNPNTGTFRFEYTAQMQDKVQVSVLDVTGKVLFAREYESNGIQLEEEIRLTTQQKGSYFLRLVNGMSVSWQKIIVE